MRLARFGGAGYATLDVLQSALRDPPRLDNDERALFDDLGQNRLGQY